MNGIQLSWTIIFWGAILLFFLVEIVVVVGGGRDLLDMVRSLGKAAEESDGDEPG